MHGGACEGDLACAVSQRERAAHGCFIPRWHALAFGGGTGPPRELSHEERLQDKVVGPQAEHPDAVDLAGGRAEHDQVRLRCCGSSRGDQRQTGG